MVAMPSIHPVPMLQWMQDFYNSGELVKENGFSRTSDGLYIVWDDSAQTGFVFGDSVYTGRNYKEAMLRREELLIKDGFTVRGNIRDSSGTESFIYSRRAT